MWAFFHKLGSPRWFYGIAARLSPWCWALALVLILVGSVWGLAFAPADYQQGNSFRIIYVHVPAAWTSFLAIGVAALCSAIYLWLRDDRLDRAALCAAEGRADVEGTILFNGRDISDVQHVYALRRRIGVVFPLPVGLPLSVYENVAFASPCPET